MPKNNKMKSLDEQLINFEKKLVNFSQKAFHAR
jgi:hypothetical protein